MEDAPFDCAGRHDMTWSRAITATDIKDIDGLAAVATDGIASDCVQLEAKPFRGRWTVVRLTSAVVQFGRQELAIVRRVRLPADKWAFVLPIVVPGPARWDGRVLTAGEIIVCPPQTESYAFDPAGMQFAMISAPTETAVALMGSEETGLLTSSGSQIVRPTSGNLLHLRRRLLELKSAAEMGLDASTSFDLLKVQNEIFRALGDCLQRVVTSYNNSMVSRSRSEIVRRAEQFVRERIGEPISIARLSTFIGISERSLRNAFYDVYTTSPKRYLKIWQLHRARHALRAADDGQATVTTVATLHGFFELGRFAGEYKALFGETPSQTLQKAKARMVPAAGPLLSGLELQGRATA